ncbi:MAG: transglutaminase-like domain-containing protein [Planctomycetota bacterium]
MLRFAFLFAACAAALAEEPIERRFVLQVRGADAGFATCRETVAADGTRTIEGETLLKLLQGGEETVLRSRRTTVIGAGETVPRAYSSTATRDDRESTYEAEILDKAIVLKATIRGAPTQVKFPLATVAGLLDHNAPEHFEVFLGERRKTPGKFQCFLGVVEMMAALPIAGEVKGEEEVAADEATVLATKVEFNALGMLYRAWLDGEGRVARLQVPSQSFEAVRTKRRIEEFEISPADLMRSFSVPLRLAEGVQEPDGKAREPQGVVEARFRVHVKVGENRTDDAVLSNSHQVFEAAAGAEPGWVDGTLTVREARQAVEEDLAPFLAPEDAIESDAPEVVERAREVIPDGVEPSEAARLASEWVHGAMRYETQLVSALAAHQGRVGDCLSYSRLTIALLRARGVPARTIGGISLGRSKRLGQHHWVEVHGGPGVGWFQIDPTYGQSTGVDAFHLDLWRQGTFDGPADNWVELLSWKAAE